VNKAKEFSGGSGMPAFPPAYIRERGAQTMRGIGGNGEAVVAFAIIGFMVAMGVLAKILL
jgi:hypothetical protein